MKKNLRTLVLASTIFAVALIPALSRAQEVSTESDGLKADQAFVADLTDPMFNRYVNFDMLGWAWLQRDPVLLTDCALELAEAEKKLLRGLHSVDSAKLLKKAIVLAADQRDMETLDRITKYATTSHQNDLLAAATSAQRLAGAERAIMPVLTVDLITMPMDKIIVLKELVGDIDKARINGNKEWLKAFAETVSQHETLNAMYEKQEIAALKKFAEESEKMTTESDENAKNTEDVLDRLAGEERKPPSKGEQIGAAAAMVGIALVAKAIDNKIQQQQWQQQQWQQQQWQQQQWQQQQWQQQQQQWQQPWTQGGGGYSNGYDTYNQQVVASPDTYNPNVFGLYNPGVAAAFPATQQPKTVVQQIPVMPRTPLPQRSMPQQSQPQRVNGVQRVGW